MGTMLRFFGWQHKLSHLHPAPIRVDSRPWHTVEQPYQSIKAICMRQQEWMVQILRQEPSGRQQKILSHDIEIFNKKNWDKIKYYIMLNLDYRKYDQNPHLMNYLLSTGTRRLVENNPRDPFWGPPGNATGEILEIIRDHFNGTNISDGKLPSILIVGDSLVKGVSQDELSRKLGKEVLCLALSGAPVEFIFQACRFLIGPYVETLIVFGGTNTIATRDNKPRMGPSNLVKKFQRFAVQVCDSNTGTRIVLSNILNRPRSSGSRIESHIKRFNAALQEAELPEKCKVLSFEPFPEELFYDGLHLEDSGSKRLSDIFVDELQ
jgi:ribA/ribD-fused uncharacterized protein